ncbi:MAG TPA: sulfotransferase [Rhizomicrobium sp.]|jgi:tetratricopeptide (TPR) repeat protein|nr:sulfotransferase [Rhizomicrobium sp.]
MAKNRDAAQDAQTLSAIEAAASGQDVPRAVQLARAALADGLVDPMLLNLRSYWWSNQGRYTEALNDLRQALAIAPTDLLVRNAYGMLLGKLERWTETLAVLRETAAMAPDYAVAQFSLGWALERTGELDEARQCFETAAALDPGFVKPLVHLADFAQRRSDLAAARDLAHRALALEPGQYVALTILAIVALAEGDLAGAEALVTPLLGRKPEAPLDASLARRVLGDVRHAQARYPQAFAAYTESNRQKYAIYAQRFETPGTTATDYANWLAAYFASADPALWSARRDGVSPDAKSGASGHVFLVGFPRSGTTLLENVLASHPGVCTLEEKDTFGELTHAFLVNEQGRDHLARLTEAEIATHRATYWARVAKFGAAVEGKVFVDKYPLTSLKLPMVAKLFPEAKILFAVRDPRDVVLSCYRRNFAMNSSMFEFLEIGRAARFYDAVMALSTIYRTRLGLDWHQIRNEALVEDFEGEARKACAFMGLDWSAQMNDFAQHAKSRTIRTPSSVQVVRGINKDGVGQWRHYRAEMAPALPTLKRWVETFGYAAE